MSTSARHAITHPSLVGGWKDTMGSVEGHRNGGTAMFFLISKLNMFFLLSGSENFFPAIQIKSVLLQFKINISCATLVKTFFLSRILHI